MITMDLDFLSVGLRESAEFRDYSFGSPISLLQMYVLMQVTKTQVWQQSVGLSVMFTFW